MEATLTQNRIVSELLKSPHRDFSQYVPLISEAARTMPDFAAHLLTWNLVNGDIRDSLIALPVITLSVAEFPNELVESSLACLASLDPRNFLRAIRYATQLEIEYQIKSENKKAKPVTGKFRGCHPSLGRARSLRRLTERYLRAREANWGWWTRSAVQHRGPMKELYTLARVKPCETANRILFGRSLDKTKCDPPKGTIFWDIRNLKNMSAHEAAAAIVSRKIPFLIAAGALGDKVKDTDLALALINRMTATELVTNTKLLERLGIKTNPVLKSAYEQGLEKVSESKKNILKTTTAADNIDDDSLREKLRGAQERQMKAVKGIDGDWLVLADKSGSMSTAIEASRHIAGTLAKMVRGSVTLIFFDTMPYGIDVTGKDYDEIRKLTERVTANGGTSIGCGLMLAVQSGKPFDGIVIVSDAAENSAPQFAFTLKAVEQSTGKNYPVYLYRVSGGSNYSDIDLARSMAAVGRDLQEFDLRGAKLDYYALPNLVKTMSVNRYSLIQAIMDTPLLKIEDVLPLATKRELAHA